MNNHQLNKHFFLTHFIVANAIALTAYFLTTSFLPIEHPMWVLFLSFVSSYGLGIMIFKDLKEEQQHDAAFQERLEVLKLNRQYSQTKE